MAARLTHCPKCGGELTDENSPSTLVSRHRSGVTRSCRPCSNTYRRDRKRRLRRERLAALGVEVPPEPGVVLKRGRARADVPVYFITDDAGHVKIGATANPEERLGQLQIGNAHRLRLIATEPGGELREAELHRAFARYHVHGEWFMLGGELARYLLKMPARTA